ncbi:MAG: tetraacyldisaccharide 4'-kinase [Actinomycetota bacterium]
MSDFETGWRRLIAGEERTWWAPPARLGLCALSGLYGAIVGTYRSGFDLGLLSVTTLPCATVAIGNITVGGTGKTTTVRWLVRTLEAWGVRPAVLSYGYRAGASKSEKNAVTIVAGPEGVREPVEVSGDEPQMLARSLPGTPLLIGRKRIRSGQRAWDEFRVDVCVLDDAFQYWRLKKDLEIVLVNAANPFGHGRLLPAGMLREPLRGLRRADAVIITHAAALTAESRKRLTTVLRRWKPTMVIAEAVHVPVRLRDHHTGAVLPLSALHGSRWLALSGLGQPESFETTLAEVGVSEAIPARFPDHHAYLQPELEAAVAQVKAGSLSGIVTTEKDAVKIPAGWVTGCSCLVLEVDLQFRSGQDAIEALVRERVTTRLSAVEPPAAVQETVCLIRETDE